MSVNLLGQRFIIVNDPESAIDLLDKTGTTFADRPPLPMATLCGYNRSLSAQQYGPRFVAYSGLQPCRLSASGIYSLRQCRKSIGRIIGSRASMSKFHPIVNYQSTMFLRRVLDDPDKLQDVHTFLPQSVFMLIVILTVLAGYEKVRCAPENTCICLDHTISGLQLPWFWISRMDTRSRRTARISLSSSPIWWVSICLILAHEMPFVIPPKLTIATVFN